MNLREFGFEELFVVLEASEFHERLPVSLIHRDSTGGCRGGNRYVEGEPRTFGELMLDDSLPSHYRLFNVR